MQDNIKKNTYNTIDLFKFIFSLFVVAIHIPPFTSVSTPLHFFTLYLSRLAVPFYFICSGYFLFKKSTSNIYKYVYRIFKLYVIWSIIYLPCVLHSAIVNKANIAITLTKWFKSFVFVGSYIHLWYLLATVVAVLIVAFCLKMRLSIKSILILSCIFYIIGLIPQTYSFLLDPIRKCESIFLLLKFIQKIIVTTRNGLFEGFLFISLGMLFARKYLSIKIKHAAILFLASMFFLGCELIVVRFAGWARAYDLFIFLAPASFFLFYIVKTKQLKNRAIYTKLRTLSSLIFFSHLLIEYILNIVLTPVLPELWSYSLFRYTLVIIATLGFSLCVMTLSKKPHFTWLKNIY
ncbi:MAG: acyltransferase family protein [Clostridia bacterium]|nr:acyltransferase family protein [Clostridia bacterium]